MRALIAASLLVFLLGSCNKNPFVGGTVVIALSSDAEVLNPLFAAGSNTSLVNYFLFPDLVEHAFDSVSGQDQPIPALARSWEFSSDGKNLTYHLRSGVVWTNGNPVTAQDIAYSFKLYADPRVASVRKSKFSLLLPDLNRAVEVINDSTIVFHFNGAYSRSMMLDHSQLAFLPKSAWDTVPPEHARTSPLNFHPITAKQFTLDRWTPRQEIRLKRNPDWDVPSPAHLESVVFRIIPDMSTRLVELKTGNVDFVEGISPEDAFDLQRSNPEIRIESQSYRRYEIAGWSNIDVKAYETSKGKVVKPHPLFGDVRVRQALTCAIDRQAMMETWFGNFAQPSIGPVSPAFRWAYNDSLLPPEHSIGTSRELLRQAGWKDHDGDGILDKDGGKFEFAMTTNAGNPRREFIVQRIQSELAKLGIIVHPQIVESSVFTGGLRKRTFDAFVTGFTVNMRIDLMPQFGSDLEINTFNAASYQNRSVDSLLAAADQYDDPKYAGAIYKEIQAHIYADQPVTFLFWYDNIVAIQNRLKGTHVDIYSPYHRFYDWYIGDAQ